MADDIQTGPETPAAKTPRIEHGKPHPEADALVTHLYAMTKANAGNPSAVLQWLTERPASVVRLAVLRTMTGPWSVASEPLVDSLTDDQARGVLAMAVVGVWQGVTKAQAELRAAQAARR